MKPLVAILTAIAVIAAMRASKVVTMPLGVGLFVVVLAWPLQHRLELRLSRWFSLAVTISVIVGVVAVFVATLVVCGNNIASKGPEYEPLVAERIEWIQAWAERWGLSIRLGEFEPRALVDQTVGMLGKLLNWIYGFFGSLVLIAAFLILALLEVRDYQAAIQRIDSETSRKLLLAISDAAHSIRRFVMTRTLTSALTGTCTGLVTLLVGLDFALVWAVLAFLLNYIPVIGSIIAVIPPTLLALIHPEAVWVAPVTLGSLALLQFSIGNNLDPRLQGHFLSLSPLVLFFSLAFWGWVWGIPGAVIGESLTVTLLTVCHHFESSRWIPDLIARRKGATEPVLE